ncbi:MAG: 7-carboxy-7-deazaguanine synthase QueE [Flavobacteriales bacterium]|nr:7-carboxy-7-deazaguanine synthase QueE [Flavobacteriales bacterium]
MEHFYTLQGEGTHAGKAAYFLRLGGCNVGCVWCDVKESWPLKGWPLYTAEELLRLVQASGAPNVVITGGEPLLYDLTPLTATLGAAGLNLWLETSGAYPLTGQWNWIVLSPKKFKEPVEGIHRQAHELKVVVYHPSDLDWALKHAALVRPECRLFVQPEWSRRHRLEPLLVEFVKAHPQWQLSLQTHKYLGIP